MNIGEHLTKDCWTRRIPVDSDLRSRPSGSGYFRPKVQSGSGYAYISLTQDDFLNEIEPSAHEVNSQYMSRRPIYGPTGNKNSKGEAEWKITGYDKVETVALGLQKSIAFKKVSHFASKGFWVANETEKEKEFSILSSWKDSVGLNTAFLEMVSSCFNTGDGAIYLYQHGKDIEYEVFSYMKGDLLFPDVDEDGDEVLYRKYRLKGTDAVDVFSKRGKQTWLMTKEDNNFFGRLKTLVQEANGKKSDDGYILISETPSQTGDISQVVYWRIPDIPSGPAQLSIEALENACSYIAEEVKNSAFPILFLKSEKVVSLPPSKMNGKALGIKGTSENLAHSDAKFLAPPDASNISKVHLDELMDNITKTTMCVWIEPDILKAGADSSTTIKILFQPEIAWCQNMWPYFFKGVKRLMEIFKILVGKVEGNLTDFASLKLSVGQEIWIPQNSHEEIDNELQQVYARVKSRKAAMEDLGNAHVGDFEQIEKEWEKEIEIKSRIPAEEKAKVEQKYGATSEEVIDIETDSNPNKPNVDNNSKGKTILE